MKIGNHDVNIKRDDVTNEIVVYISVGADEYTTLRCSPLQAASMTVERLEKMIKTRLEGR